MKAFGTDYDGVIINIEPQKATAFGELLYKEWGISKEQASKFWIAKGGTSRRYKFDHFFEEKFSKKLPVEIYNIIESKYSDLLKSEFYPKIKLLSGALNLLKFARSHFDFTFVSSGAPTKEIEYLINLKGVSDYFDLILGTDDHFRSKTDHFIEVIQKQKPDLIVFVADSPEDMKVAKDTKAIAIGVLTNHTKPELLNAGAKYVCEIKDATGLLRTIVM